MIRPRLLAANARPSAALRWTLCATAALAGHTALIVALRWPASPPPPVPRSIAMVFASEPPALQSAILAQPEAAAPPVPPLVPEAAAPRPVEMAAPRPADTATPDAPMPEAPIPVLLPASPPSAPPPRPALARKPTRPVASAGRASPAPSPAATPAMPQPGPAIHPAAVPSEPHTAPDPNQVAAWQGALLGQLQRAKRYPDAARAAGDEGVAVIAFTLDAAGHVVSMRLVRSSGSSALDDEAQALVRRAEPLPPPPAGTAVSLTVPIRFALR